MIRAHAVSQGSTTYAESFTTTVTPVDPRLDAEDLARVMTTFRGQPIRVTPTMRYVRCAADGTGTAYVFDEDSGMVWILD